MAQFLSASELSQEGERLELQAEELLKKPHSMHLAAEKFILASKLNPDKFVHLKLKGARLLFETAEYTQCETELSVLDQHMKRYPGSLQWDDGKREMFKRLQNRLEIVRVSQTRVLSASTGSGSACQFPEFQKRPSVLPLPRIDPVLLHSASSTIDYASRESMRHVAKKSSSKSRSSSASRGSVKPRHVRMAFVNCQDLKEVLSNLLFCVLDEDFPQGGKLEMFISHEHPVVLARSLFIVCAAQEWLNVVPDTLSPSEHRQFFSSAHSPRLMRFAHTILTFWYASHVPTDTFELARTVAQKFVQNSDAYADAISFLDSKTKEAMKLLFQSWINNGDLPKFSLLPGDDSVRSDLSSCCSSFQAGHITANFPVRTLLPDFSSKTIKKIDCRRQGMESIEHFFKRTYLFPLWTFAERSATPRNVSDLRFVRNPLHRYRSYDPFCHFGPSSFSIKFDRLRSPVELEEEQHVFSPFSFCKPYGDLFNLEVSGFSGIRPSPQSFANPVGGNTSDSANAQNGSEPRDDLNSEEATEDSTDEEDSDDAFSDEGSDADEDEEGEADEDIDDYAAHYGDTGHPFSPPDEVAFDMQVTTLAEAIFFLCAAIDKQKRFKFVPDSFIPLHCISLCPKLSINPEIIESGRKFKTVATFSFFLGDWALHFSQFPTTSDSQMDLICFGFEADRYGLLSPLVESYRLLRTGGVVSTVPCFSESFFVHSCDVRSMDTSSISDVNKRYLWAYLRCTSIQEVKAFLNYQILETGGDRLPFATSTSLVYRKLPGPAPTTISAASSAASSFSAASYSKSDITEAIRSRFSEWIRDIVFAYLYPPERHRDDDTAVMRDPALLRHRMASTGNAVGLVRVFDHVGMLQRFPIHVVACLLDGLCEDGGSSWMVRTCPDVKSYSNAAAVRTARKKTPFAIPYSSIDLQVAVVFADSVMCRRREQLVELFLTGDNRLNAEFFTNIRLFEPENCRLGLVIVRSGSSTASKLQFSESRDEFMSVLAANGSHDQLLSCVQVLPDWSLRFFLPVAYYTALMNGVIPPPRLAARTTLSDLQSTTRSTDRIASPSCSEEEPLLYLVRLDRWEIFTRPVRISSALLRSDVEFCPHCRSILCHDSDFETSSNMCISRFGVSCRK
eukprot:ANDGO_07344.mRNA.1 hypothetical protein